MHRLYRMPIIKKFSFKIPITIWKKRGSSLIDYKDFGRKVEKWEGGQMKSCRIYLKEENAHAPYPTSKYILPNKKIHYLELADKKFAPCLPKLSKAEEKKAKKGEEEKFIAAVPKMSEKEMKEVETWEVDMQAAESMSLNQRIQNAKDVYERSTLDKWLPVISIAAIGIFMVMGLIITSQQNSMLVNHIGGIVNQLSNVAGKIAEAAGSTGGVVSPP